MIKTQFNSMTARLSVYTMTIALKEEVHFALVGFEKPPINEETPDRVLLPWFVPEER